MASVLSTDSISDDVTNMSAFHDDLGNGSTSVMTPGFPGNRTAYIPPDLSHIKYIAVAFYPPIFIFGLIGNGLVLYVIARFSKVRQRSVANYYIWNLALADQLHMLTLPWFFITSFTNHWMFGDVLCRVTYVLRECNKFASIFTLVALTIDRYLATYHNLGRFRTIRVGKGVCLAIWACCLLSCTPYLMYSYTEVKGRDNNTVCAFNWPSPQFRVIWTYTQLVIGYLLPLAVIVLFNVLLLNRLRGMVRPGAAGEKRASRNNSSMTKTVLTVVIIFLVCQAPYYVMEIISLAVIRNMRQYRRLPTPLETQLFAHFNVGAQILVYISSSCNPIIYGVFNRNFRNLYREVLCCGYFSEESVKRRHKDYTQVPRRPTESNTCCTTVELINRSPQPKSNPALVTSPDDVNNHHETVSPKISSQSM